jgi:ribonuclease HII
LEKKDVELVCENYADETYPIVSAASIIAKVSRDEDIEELKKKVGYDFGVGYPHDARTIEFIKKLVIENKGKLPNYIRHTWATVETIVAEHKQTRVLSFLEKLIKK